jgi:hypothetical protein
MATPSYAVYPTLTLALYPSLSEKQFGQVAEDITKKRAGPLARLMVVGTPVGRGRINPLDEGPDPAVLVGIWKSQTDTSWFRAGTFTPRLEAAGVPNSDKVPWFTSEIHTLKETIVAGKPYERFAEPRPMLVIDTNPDQTPEQFDKVMEHLAKRGPGHRGGRHRHVDAAAGLPSGAQLMMVAGATVTPRLGVSEWRKVDGAGRMAISIWNSEDDADRFVTDFIAASQELGVPTSDKAWSGKSTIHTLMRP